MNDLVPSMEESRVFFGNAELTPLIVTSKNIRSFAAGGDLTVDKSDLLVGESVPTAIGFTDNLDEDKKQAAADSIHFAERYADTYSDKNSKPIEWHGKYAIALKHCGWTLTNHKYQDQVSKQTTITMDAIVLDIVKATAGRNAPALTNLLKGAFNKIQSDGELVTLFDKNSSNGGDKDFRLVPCLQTPGGTAIATLVAVDCELSTSQGGAWFWKWNLSNLRMKRVATVMELNMAQHERRKDQIIELLDVNSDEFFKGVKLK
ncbi:hypothetical protein [Pseudomonas mandelii]|uniref:hypothetical protein n=1 Tax=Pseudomonas mandelii TaxID=75612 RepID=UPI00224A8152|nr:hypothetical protein [Pseudomonas mandelii]MCX2897208.1 hypothetical protein [Pseudomonas mandelii]